MAAAPTTTEIRAWTDLDLARQGYGTDAVGEARLELQLNRALAYLVFVTARKYDDVQTDSFPMVKAVLDQAVQMRVEQLVLSLKKGVIETAADFDMISSFSAGSYSESRRDVAAGAPGTSTKPLNPWPALNDLLWMLLSLFPGESNDAVSDRFDYWRWVLTGIVAPAWQTVEVAWGRGMGLSSWYDGFHNVLPPLAGPLPEMWDSRLG